LQQQQLYDVQQVQPDPHLAAAFAGLSSQQLVGVSGRQPVLQEWDGSSKSSSSIDDEGAAGVDREGSTGQQWQQRESTGASAEGQGEGVLGGEEQQQPWRVERCSSSANSGGVGSEISSYESSLAVGEDEAVWSMSRLLPARYAAWSTEPADPVL
jgi:hypothetical protein